MPTSRNRWKRLLASYDEIVTDQTFAAGDLSVSEALERFGNKDQDSFPYKLIYYELPAWGMRKIAGEMGVTHVVYDKRRRRTPLDLPVVYENDIFIVQEIR